MSTSLSIPKREFGPAPWWAWMGEMSRDSIDRNLKRFLDMEIYELITIPLYGLQPEYLGDAYFSLYRHACERCREWGIKLWIYDEMNWPSGTCAGRVLHEYPEARQHAIRFGGDSSGTGVRQYHTWDIVPCDRFQLAAYGAEWVKPVNGYVDTLNANAVSAFIELTHEAYKREVGEFFGDVILGFFTDEPVVNFQHGAFPYTPALFDTFQHRYGYDLRPSIHLLAVDGPEASRVRRDYWSLVIELFRESFFEQYAGWCEDHGLKMTGHLLFEEMLEGNLTRNGDMFEMLSTMQVPGIDLLGGATSFDGGDFDPRRDVTGKLIDSIAYFAGRERTLCEAFGCMPHSATPRKYKRAVDFLFHHGLSMINDNLFPDSMSSFRKFCGCHAFATPWSRHYGLFSRYVQTMSRLNSGSRLVTSLGVYYPGTDARSRYKPPESTLLGPYYQDAGWDATQAAVKELVHGLVQRHWDYYLVFDQILQQGRAGSAGLRMRDFDCRVLVFPDIHCVDPETAKALRRFVKAGGVMVCVGRIPEVLGEDGSVRPGRWGAAERVLQVGGSRENFLPDVVRVLDKMLKKPLPLSGAGTSDVMATRRLTDAGEVVFLTNFGEKTTDVDLDIDGQWRRLDAVTREQGEPLASSERLLPGESALFVRTSGRGRGRRAPSRERMETFLMDDTWEFSLRDGNTVALPMSLYKGRQAGRPPVDAPAKAWTAPFVEEAPRDLRPEKPVWLRREIDVQYSPGQLFLVVDGCDRCEVYVNRTRVRGVEGGCVVWDDENVACDLRPAIRRGRNEILLRYTPAKIRKYVSRMVPLTDVPPFVLKGDFLAASRMDREDVMPALAALPGTIQTGSLHARGYPGFVGIADYAQTFRLPGAGGRVEVDMGAQNDMFEVEINGKSAGVLGWAPYRLDITDYVRRGENRIMFRLHTALAGVLSRHYKTLETSRPPVGLLETPVLHRFGKA